MMSGMAPARPFPAVLRAACAALALLAAAAGPARAAHPVPPPGRPASEPFLDEVEHRTFDWFWDHTPAATGLVPDRWPTRSFSSVAAIGFGLTCDGVGAERGWVSRAAARERVLAALRFLWAAPQGPGTK